MRGSRRLLALIVAGPILTLGVARAASHIYSYDPADAATREAAGPLTFEVYKGVFGGTTIRAMRSTVAAATADLRRGAARDLGPRGLADVPGAAPHLRDLYEVQPSDEGAALIAALCPGARRAWIVFGDVGYNESLRIEVLGDQPGAAPSHVRVCHQLVYDFHGEWRGPPSGPVLRERDLLRGRYPGT
jgi:hypothetical protein